MRIRVPRMLFALDENKKRVLYDRSNVVFVSNWGYFCMATLLGLSLLVALSVWVYKDAKARGEKQAGFWAFGTLLLAIVVVPAWFIHRAPKEDELRAAETVGTKRCPFCAEQIQAAAIKCRFCGSALEAVPQSVADSPTLSPRIASIGLLEDRTQVATSLSFGRVLAKTSHLLALGWTVFCTFGVLFGMANVSNSLGSDISGAAALGVGVGLGVWGVVWFMPVVGLEIVALAAMALGKNNPADDAMVRREWQRAFWISAGPNALLLITILGMVVGGSTPR
jgi:hypothetical protein